MNVRTFALTYPQLMNQAIDMKLAEEDLFRLRKAYELSERLFDGLYRGQHAPFLCHLVRTASILLAEKMSIETVIAGLLHAAYTVGYFQDQRHGCATPIHRKELQDSIGGEVEVLVFNYNEGTWYKKEHLENYLESVKENNSNIKTLVLMHLANELEDYLDYGMAYRGTFPFRERINAYGSLAVELAKRLGHLQLAEELNQVFEIHLNSNLPKIVLTNQSSSFQLPSLKWLKKSYLEKLRYKTGKLIAQLSGSKNQVEELG